MIKLPIAPHPSASFRSAAHRRVRRLSPCYVFLAYTPIIPHTPLTPSFTLPSFPPSPVFPNNPLFSLHLHCCRVWRWSLRTLAQVVLRTWQQNFRYGGHSLCLYSVALALQYLALSVRRPNACPTLHPAIDSPPIPPPPPSPPPPPPPPNLSLPLPSSTKNSFLNSTFPLSTTHLLLVQRFIRYWCCAR